MPARLSYEARLSLAADFAIEVQARRVTMTLSNRSDVFDVRIIPTVPPSLVVVHPKGPTHATDALSRDGTAP